MITDSLSKNVKMVSRCGRTVARCRWLLRLHFPGCYPQIDSTPVPLCYNAQFTACIIYIVMYSNYVYSVWYLYPHMDSYSSILPCYNVLHWRSTLYNTKKYKMWIKIMFWNSDGIQTKNTIVSFQKTPQNTILWTLITCCCVTIRAAPIPLYYNREYLSLICCPQI